MHPSRILFICTGNICRSPLAEGIFRHIAINAEPGKEFEIDSAGTGGWHRGEAPDKRSVAVAAGHGVDISHQRARRIDADDFARFDLILAMDRDNLANLLKIAPADTASKIHLFNTFAGAGNKDVPDPYYGRLEDFEAVYTMLFEGCSALLAALGNTRAS